MESGRYKRLALRVHPDKAVVSLLRVKASRVFIEHGRRSGTAMQVTQRQLFLGLTPLPRLWRQCQCGDDCEDGLSVFVACKALSEHDIDACRELRRVLRASSAWQSGRAVQRFACLAVQSQDGIR